MFYKDCLLYGNFQYLWPRSNRWNKRSTLNYWWSRGSGNFVYWYSRRCWVLGPQWRVWQGKWVVNTCCQSNSSLHSRTGSSPATSSSPCTMDRLPYKSYCSPDSTGSHKIGTPSLSALHSSEWGWLKYNRPCTRLVYSPRSSSGITHCHWLICTGHWSSCTGCCTLPSTWTRFCIGYIHAWSCGRCSWGHWRMCSVGTLNYAGCSSVGIWNNPCRSTPSSWVLFWCRCPTESTSIHFGR